MLSKPFLGNPNHQADLRFIEHVSQRKPGLLEYPDRLHVVCCVINPMRFNRRYELYRNFEKHMSDSGAILWTAEIQQGGRQFEVTEPNNPRHLQLRTYHELWHKENSLNLLINRLPPEAKYVAWGDADVMFANERWVQDSLHALQHYDVIQPWSHCQDLGPQNERIEDAWRGKNVEVLPSMMHQWVNGTGWGRKFDLHKKVKNNNYYTTEKLSKGDLGHPGYFYCARRSAIDTMGGLLDFSITGSCDRHQAFGLIGRIRDSVNPKMNQSFLHALDLWQERALRLNRNVGYIPGLLLHKWHGSKKLRQYETRWQILIDNDFDPNRDIFRDAQGLYQLTPEKWRLRDDLRTYFRNRDEDSTSVY